MSVVYQVAPEPVRLAVLAMLLAWPAVLIANAIGRVWEARAKKRRYWRRRPARRRLELARREALES